MEVLVDETSGFYALGELWVTQVSKGCLNGLKFVFLHGRVSLAGELCQVLSWFLDVALYFLRSICKYSLKRVSGPLYAMLNGMWEVL